MKIRTKIVWFLWFLILIFTSVLIIQRRYEQNRLDALSKSIRVARESIFDKVSDLQGVSVQTFSYDYSFWDEMVNFVTAPDEKWASENIEVGLTTFKANAAWVYNIDRKLVYSVNNLNAAAELKEIPIPNMAIANVFMHKPFCHFFVDTPKGLMEFHGATIHPSSDSKRETPAKGYFFCSSLWDEKYINSLSELTSSKITMVDIKERQYLKPEKNVVSFSRALLGWDDRPAKYLLISIASETIESAEKEATKLSLLFIAFSLITLSGIYFFINFWINIPLKSISLALRIYDSAPLKRMLEQRDEFGDVSRLIDNFFAQRKAVIQEIAARKTIEEELKRKTEVLEAQNEASLDGKLVVDENGQRVLTNKRLIELWKVPQYILDDKNDKILLQYVVSKTKNPQEFLDKVNYLYAHKSETSKDEIEFKDGRIFERYSSPITDKNGKNFGRIWTFRDITERRNMEVEREISLNRQKEITMLQQSLLVSEPLAIKLNAMTSGIVRIFNADFCRIWLIRPGDLCEQGCSHAQVKEGPHICRFRDKCLHLMSSSGRYTHIDGKAHARVPFGCYKIGRIASGQEHKFLTNDVINDPRVHNHEWARELGLVSFAGYQLSVPGGETMGVLGLFAKHPILSAEDAALDSLSTTIAFIVQQAVAEEAVANAMKIKSDFTSVVSHELRTPLTAIKESISIVLEEAAGKLNDEQKDFLEMSHRNVERLSRLINDVLDYQKLESGKFEFDIQENDINEVIEEVQNMMASVVKNKGLDIIVNLDKTLPKIKFDRDKIIQVLTNLINNAMKFTEKGNITIISAKKDNVVHLTVKDTGPGIKEEDLPRLFVAFEQLEKGKDRKTGGTGLGLAISKEIIEKHKGKIWAESELGKGSAFHIILPVIERRV